MLATRIQQSRRHDTGRHSRQMRAATLSGRAGRIREPVGVDRGDARGSSAAVAVTSEDPTRGPALAASSVPPVGVGCAPVHLFGATADAAMANGGAPAQQLQEPAPAAPMPA